MFDQSYHSLPEVGSVPPRTFHIWNFPQEEIFALLEPSYRAKLVAPLIEKSGLRLLSELIHVGSETVSGWAAEQPSLPGNPRTGYIRLDALFHLAELSPG
jgi:hypothetical protein